MKQILRARVWRSTLKLLAALSLIITSSFAEEKPAVVSIVGAGATFPYPLYSKWFSEFKKSKPNVEINYQSIGSGGGVRQLLERTIDFGASDAPMKDEQLKKSRERIYHFPAILGAVVITYNLPTVKAPLKLSGEVLVNIFMGKVYYWNDPSIQALNKDIILPDLPIMVVHRSDGSGTTAVFTDYLSKVSQAWKDKVGSSTSVKWPLGLGGKGNEGVTGFVKHSVGAIGYIELLYANKNKLPVVHLQNASGQFIEPKAESVTLAAQSFIKDLPDDFRLSITNSKAPGAYPIACLTYLLFYETLKKNQYQALTQFLDWAYLEGQELAVPLDYAKLPSEWLTKIKLQIKKLKQGSQ